MISLGVSTQNSLSGERWQRIQFEHRQEIIRLELVIQREWAANVCTE